ncbi:three-Cys-motif partner protein TcmP [Larkinella sp.]|uniref:three-Cys-motif partner protein TcmP n=1 Tax=Larkinella sp. TaxID=2034517 RepID=UPI003BAADA32
MTRETKDIVLHLNDIKSSNIENIEKYLSEKSNYKNYKVEYPSKEAESLLFEITEKIKKQDNSIKSLIFLDPYGYKNIDLKSLNDLMDTGKVEIILFLPVSHMNRFKEEVQEKNRAGYEALRRFISTFFE